MSVQTTAKPVPVPKDVMLFTSGAASADPGAQPGPVKKAKSPEVKPAPVDIGATIAAAMQTTIAPAPAPVQTADVDQIPGVINVTISAILGAKILAMPHTGGGWQGLIGDLAGALVGPIALGDDGPTIYVVKIPVALFARVVTYSVKHGGGGYQAALRELVCNAVAQHGIGGGK